MLSTVDLVSLFSLLGATLDQRVLAGLRDAGFRDLRVSHGYIVQRLLVEPRTATELAVELGVTQQAVSKLAAEMAAAGYIARTTDPVDRRRSPLTLTERGRQAVATTRQIRAELGRQIVGQATPEEAEAVRAFLVAALESFDVVGAIERRMVPLPPEPNSDAG